LQELHKIFSFDHLILHLITYKAKAISANPLAVSAYLRWRIHQTKGADVSCVKARSGSVAGISRSSAMRQKLICRCSADATAGLERDCWLLPI